MQMEMEEIKGADVISAGFPCQDISFCGKGAGLSGERSGLFWQTIRTIRMVRPSFALLENVAALLNRGMGTVLGRLAFIGYDTEWYSIQARDVGAPHQRNRIHIMAYTYQSGRDSAPRQSPNFSKVLWEKISAASSLSICERTWDESVLPSLGLVDGISTDLDSVAAYGNSNPPQIYEAIGRAIIEQLNNSTTRRAS